MSDSIWKKTIAIVSSFALVFAFIPSAALAKTSDSSSVAGDSPTVVEEAKDRPFIDPGDVDPSKKGPNPEEADVPAGTDTGDAALEVDRQAKASKQSIDNVKTKPVSGSKIRTLEDAESDEATDQGKIEWSFDEETLTLTISGKGAMDAYGSGSSAKAPWVTQAATATKLVVEEGVTVIGAYAFYYMQKLTEVSLPSTLTAINYNAFDSCKALTQIQIPDSVTSLGCRAFVSCTGLVSANVPASWNSCPSYNPNYSGSNYQGHIFEGCTNLKTIDIPEELDALPDYAFSNCNKLQTLDLSMLEGLPQLVAFGCSSLTSVKLPAKATKIPWCAFENCSSLSSIDLPSTITEIDCYSLKGCKALTELVIPDSVTTIGYQAFCNCTALASAKMPASWTTCSSYREGSSGTGYQGHIFEGCKTLTTVEIPDGLTTLPVYAFNACNNLTSITIPSSVTKMKRYAFYACSALTKVVLPDEMTSIGFRAFMNCSALNDVKLPVNWIECPSYDGETIDADHCGHVFEGCKALTTIEVPEGMTKLPGYAFNGSNYLEQVKLPSTLTEIGNHAFFKCSKLSSVTVPEGVTALGKSAFCYASALADVGLPSTLKQMSDFSFYDCDTLKEFVIPNSVESIGFESFAECANLESVSLPVSWKSCPNTSGAGEGSSYQGNLFYNTPNLTYVEVPEGATELPAYAFCHCNKLQTIDLPDSLTELGEYAFYNCSSLMSLSIPGPYEAAADDDVEDFQVELASAEQSPFTQLLAAATTVVTMASGNTGNGVQSIPNNCMQNCSSMTVVNVPSSTTNVGSNAFSGTNNLQTVNYGGSSSQFGNVSVNSNGNSNFNNANKNMNFLAQLKEKDFLGIWDGEYTGNTSSGKFVQRHFVMNVLESKNQKGSVVNLKGEISISPTVKGGVDATTYGATGSYHFKGSANLKTGAVSYQGYDWIQYPISNDPDTSNWLFISFSGSINKDASAIAGVNDGSKARPFSCDNILSAAIKTTNIILATEDEEYDILHTTYKVEQGSSNIYSILIQAPKGKTVSNAVLKQDILTLSANGGMFLDVPLGGILNDKDPIELEVTFRNADGTTSSKTYKPKLSIVPHTNDYQINRVDLSYNDKNRDYTNVDVSSQAYSIEVEQGAEGAIDSAAKHFSLRVQLMNPKAKVGTYELVEVDGKNEKVVATSETPTFDKVRLSKLTPNASYRMNVMSEKGKKLSYADLMLKLTQKYGNGVTISFGDALAIEAKSGFLKGMKISIDELSYPVTFSLSGDGSFSAGVNFDIEKDNSFKDQLKKGLLEHDFSQVSWDKAKKNLIVKELAGPKNFFKPTVELIGLLEGENKGDGTYEVSGHIAVNVKFTGSKEFQVHGFVVTVTGQVKVGGKGGGQMTLETLNGKLHVKEASGTVDFKGGGSIEIAGGVGIAYAGNVSVYGKAGLKCEYRLLSTAKNDTGLKKLNLEGEVGLKAVLLGKTVGSIVLLSGTLPIYPAEGSTAKAKMLSLQSVNTLANVSSEIAYQSLDEQTPDGRAKWVSAASDDPLSRIQANGYSDAQPRLIEAGGKTYLLFLNRVDSRAEGNQSQLSYSIQNADGSWSAPVAIDTDATGDYGFDAYESNGTIYVAWQDTNATVEPDATLGEVAAASDISFATIDGINGAISTEQAVTTDTSVFEMAPSIVVVDGQPAVYWMETSLDDVMGSNGGTIKKAQSQVDAWSASVVSAVDGFLTSMDAGVVDGKSQVAWSYDVDGDLETADILVASDVGTLYAPMSEDQYGAGSVQYVKSGADDCLTYYAEGALKNAAGENLASVSSGSYKLSGDLADECMLVRSYALDDVNNVAAMKCSAGVWSEEIDIPLGTLSTYQVAGLGNTVVVTATSDPDGTSAGAEARVDMYSYDTAKMPVTARLNGATYDATEIGTRDVTVSTNVTSTTFAKVAGAQVRVLKGDDELGSSTIKSIAPGQNVDVDVHVAMPIYEDEESDTYTVQLVKGDQVLDEQELEIDLMNLSVDASDVVIDGKETISATILNDGASASKACKIELYDFESGEVLKTKSVPALDAGIESIVDFENNGMFADQGHPILAVRVVTDQKQISTDDDIDSLCSWDTARYGVPENALTEEGIIEGAAPATLTLSAKTVTKTIGAKAFTLKITKSMGDGAVTYSSSNTKVAAVSKSGLVTIKGIGSAKITVKKAATSAYKASSASCSITVNPRAVTMSKLTPYAKAFTAKWAKSTSTNATGYQVRYSLKSSMASAKTVTVKGYKTVSKKISKLKAKKKYYVQVRVYKTVSGKQYYSAWSTKKSVKTK